MQIHYRRCIREVQRSPENSSSRYQIDCVIQDFPVSDEVWDKIREATADDSSLQQIIHLLKDGNRLPGKYNDYVHELHIKEGVPIKGRQVVIPSCLRGEMLQKVHEGHMGVVKLKRRARASIYWPGMGRDIYDMAEKWRTKRSKPLNLLHKRYRLGHGIR